MDEIDYKTEYLKLKKILDECLSVMPVGWLPAHTYESLPDRIDYWVKTAVEEEFRADKAEEHARVLEIKLDVHGIK